MGRGGNPIYTEDQKKKHNEKLTTTAKVVKTKHTSRFEERSKRMPSITEFPHQRYGFFTNETPSQVQLHVNSQKDEPAEPLTFPPGYVPPSLRAQPKHPMPLNFAEEPSSSSGPLFPPGSDPFLSRPAQAKAKDGPSLHELFGKMIWKKMELIKDPNVVDALQKEILDKISAVLQQQNAQSKSDAELKAERQIADHQQKMAIARSVMAASYGRLPPLPVPRAGFPPVPPAVTTPNPRFSNVKPYQGPGFF